MQTEVGRCNFMDAKLHRTSRSQICQVTYTEENCIIYSSVMVIIIVMRIMLTDKVGSSPSARLHILESRILWHSSRASHPLWNHTLKSKIPIASGRLQECVTNCRTYMFHKIYLLPNRQNWCKTNWWKEKKGFNFLEYFYQTRMFGDMGMLRQFLCIACILVDPVKLVKTGKLLKLEN